MLAPLRLVSPALLLAGAAGAQLSGTYTIDPTGSGARNFKSFQAAATATSTKGISGPVVFLVAPGTYTMRSTWTSVTGASPTNTITIRGGAGGRPRMDATRGFWIQIGSSTKKASYFRFDGLSFVRGSGGNAPIGNVEGDAFEVQRCDFYNCHLFLRGNRIKVHHNTFFGRALNLGGVEAEVHHNLIRLQDNSNSAWRIYGNTTRDAKTRVYNNVIWGKTQANPVIRVRRGIYFDHNTIALLDRKNAYSGQAPIEVDPGGGFVGPCIIRSNVIVNLNGGLVLNIDAPSVPTGVTLDGNIYWTTKSSNLFRTAGTQPRLYPNLLFWQFSTKQDGYSLQADPKFLALAAGNLDLEDNSPATLRARNTPPYVTDDFAGVKRPARATSGAYEADTPPQFETMAPGCPGSGNLIPICGYAGILKWGQTVDITVRNAMGSSTTVGFLVVGATRTAIPIGGQCILGASLHIVVPAPVPGGGPGRGYGKVPLTLPNDQSLKGARAWFQWAVTDPKSKGLGLALSNLVRFTY